MKKLNHIWLKSEHFTLKDVKMVKKENNWFSSKKQKVKKPKIEKAYFFKKTKELYFIKKTHKPLKNNEKRLDESKKTFCEKYAKIEKTKKQKFYIFDFCWKT